MDTPKETPKLSVIIPAYNAGRFLSETLDSVLAQTFTDLEILIVDDGSTDSTGEIAAAYAAKHPGKVRYFRQENRGVGVARNHGARQARGGIFAFLDADDLWLPGKIETQMAFWREHPEFGILFCDVFAMSEAGKVGAPMMRLKHPRSGEVFPWLLIENFISILTALVKREVFEKAGGFYEGRDLMGTEDHHFWLKAVQHCQAGFLDKPLACYRISQGSLSSSRVRMWRNNLAVLDRIAADFPRQASSHSDAFRKARVQNFFEMAFYQYRKGQLADARESYLKALALNPLRLDCWKGLAICSLIPGSILRKRNADIPDDEAGLLA